MHCVTVLLCYIDISCSDHYIIFASRKKFKERRGKERVGAQKYTNLDKAIFASDIANHDWNQVLHCEDPSVCWHMFVQEFNSVLDKHEPCKVMYFTETPPERATREMMALCKARDSLKKNSVKTGLPEDREIARRAKNSCNHLKRNL